jgi:hypothetical protein
LNIAVILRKLAQCLLSDTLILLTEPGYEAFSANKTVYMRQVDKPF